MNRMSFLVTKFGLGIAFGLAVSACAGDDDSFQTPGKGGAGSSAGASNKAGATSTASGGMGAGGSGGAAGEAAGAGGDADNAGGASGAHIEIAGTWLNTDFGQTETDLIDDETWSSDFGGAPTVASITEFSNSERYAVRKAPKDAAFNPGTFDRVVWTKPTEGVFYYCTVIYGCATAALTEHGDGDTSTTTCKVASVDDSDPENGGCASFPWTKLTAQ
jgi:hypothetical protein